MARQSKKASVEGKGLDLLLPPGETADGSARSSGTRPPRAEEDRQAPSSSKAQVEPIDSGSSHGESMHASMHARTDLSDSDLMIFDDAMERIREIGRVSASFRFTEAELEELDDVIYRNRKRNKVKLVKQEIVRLGLATLLAEYKERGAESVLGRYIQSLKEN